ncbi:MAG: peptidoglycan-binding protein [Pseudomonadota bacterium]
MSKLKWGSKGRDVKTLQDQLNAAGAKPKLIADGVFGKRTYEAVKAFQTSRKALKVDGVVAAKTFEALNKGPSAAARGEAGRRAG